MAFINLPYTILGPAGSSFITASFNGFAYETITGLSATVDSRKSWNAVGGTWTAPKNGLVEVSFSTTNDGYTGGAAVALFKNGSINSYLRSLSIASGGVSVKVIIVAGDVLTLRVNSNESSKLIYTNDAAFNTSFVYLPNI